MPHRAGLPELIRNRKAQKTLRAITIPAIILLQHQVIPKLELIFAD